MTRAQDVAHAQAQSLIQLVTDAIVDNRLNVVA
jgi:hypothetical protein